MRAESFGRNEKSNPSAGSAQPSNAQCWPGDGQLSGRPADAAGRRRFSRRRPGGDAESRAGRDAGVRRANANANANDPGSERERASVSLRRSEVTRGGAVTSSCKYAARPYPIRFFICFRFDEGSVDWAPLLFCSNAPLALVRRDPFAVR